MDGGRAAHGEGAGSPRPAPAVATACRCCGSRALQLIAELDLAPLGPQPVARGRLDAPCATQPRLPCVCEECRLLQLPGPAVPADPEPDELELALAEIAAQGAFVLPPGFGAAAARRLRAAGHAPLRIEARDAAALADDLHDLLAGIGSLLPPGGVATMELPYLLPLLRAGRVDALRPDLLSWFSLATAEIALMQHGLVVFDAAELPAQGGRLRLRIRHAGERGPRPTPGFATVREREAAFGLHRAEPYRVFAETTLETRRALLDFLRGARRAGQRVAGVVEAGCGAGLLAHAGIGPELLPFVVDPAPRRQGRILPGSRIPVRAPEAVLALRPDVLLLLARDRTAALAEEFAVIRAWGGRFALPGRVLQLF